MRKLPGSDLLVSEVCLGTMTFGEQVSKDQAHKQLDIATKEYGINFLVSERNAINALFCDLLL
jgi:aryl-alcohol dehydrogenase-like predicted oxidoreductase